LALLAGLVLVACSSNNNSDDDNGHADRERRVPGQRLRRPHRARRGHGRKKIHLVNTGGAAIIFTVYTSLANAGTDTELDAGEQQQLADEQRDRDLPRLPQQVATSVRSS
jgi:hypothetical protein